MAGREQDATAARQHARFTVTPESPPSVQPPAPFIPEHLLHGVFAHSVRTFIEGGNVLIDFSYNAPVDWHDGPDAEYQFEHVVVARILMPIADFQAWIANAAKGMGLTEK